MDISPEEMRSEAYKANNDGKTESYVRENMKRVFL